jgi:large subunit ribosomal protein L15
VTPESLAKAGLLRQADLPVVVLGHGEVSVALRVKVHRVSRSARAKIEAAGGSVEVLDR